MLNLFVVLAGVVILIASVIFGIVQPLSRDSVTTGGMRQVPAPRAHLLRGIIGVTIGGVILIIGFAGPFVEVPAGNVGVLTNFGRSRRSRSSPGCISSSRSTSA